MVAKKQILVVEDNWINRGMLVEILSDRYTVLEAENGQDALDILNRYKENIDLILLDVMMPVMDGFTFLNQIKSDSELALIPVIVMTQSDSEEDEVEALVHGATDYVPKPYKPQVILHRVASIINLRETAAMVNHFQYDRVTGIYTKEFFYHKAQELLRENPDKEYNLVCSNIENFKLYNDTFGIPAGDKLLKDTGAVIRKKAGTTGICGCFRADRFALLQEREIELEDRQEMSERIFASKLYNNNHVVFKYGVYEITDRTVSIEQMCDRAFLAADSIKGQYHKWLAVYDDELRSKLLREQAITDAMESSLLDGQFTVYLQPKYSLHDDGLAGAEALVRWIHPEWGFISPGEFIPLFEKNGFITRLDWYIWEQVCKILRDWKEKGYPDLPVSVNVSRSDIYHADLTENLVNLVEKYGIEPAQLHLELTESAYTENPSQIISTVEHLRNCGFIVEMDDFGSGYSSLSMLNQMKLDVLKLDMKFIQSETAKPAEQGVLQFIVSLARWMNLTVVAEGVETRAQLERLREIGCDFVQGYFFAKPMPRDEFEELLKDQSSKVCVSVKQDENTEHGIGLLIVDEDEDYRERLSKAFEGQFRVFSYDNAQEAIGCAQKYGHGNIAAVILSMSLPEKGAELFVNTLRRDPMLWRIPILATMPLCEVSEDMAIELDTDDFLCKRHPTRDVKRRVNRLISLANHQERERMLQNEACQDYLTGLLNRRGLYTAIDALRQEDLPLAMYFFDLDDLKKVNDKYGHEAGDAMLRHFGELLRRQTRDGDVLCRYGGDEFIVVLRRISSEETILQKGENVCSQFRNFCLPDGTNVACSCGIVRCSADEKPSAKLIDRADSALYRAKQENKGGCCLWEE